MQLCVGSNVWRDVNATHTLYNKKLSVAFHFMENLLSSFWIPTIMSTLMICITVHFLFWEHSAKFSCSSSLTLLERKNGLWESIHQTTGQRREKTTGKESRLLFTIEKRFIHFILEGRNCAFSNRAHGVFTNGERLPVCFSEIKSSCFPLRNSYIQHWFISRQGNLSGTVRLTHKYSNQFSYEKSH